MMKRAGTAVMILLGAISSAAAQNTVTTLGVTSPYTVPVFNGIATVGNSPITAVGSNVGIGTPSPLAPLEVVGTIRKDFTANADSGSPTSYWMIVANDGTANFNEYLNSTGTSSPSAVVAGAGFRRVFTPEPTNDADHFYYQFAPSVAAGSGQNWIDYMVINAAPNNINSLTLMDQGSNVGIGTTNPTAQLSISAPSAGDVGISLQNSTDSRFWINTLSNTLLVGGNGGTQPTSGGIAITNGGYVGIGTPTPHAALEVSGGLIFTGQAGTQTQPWTGVLCGGDYAEAVDPAGDKESYEPGDVLVITDADGGDVRKASEPYSTMVAGIYATKPGVVGRRESLPKDAQDLPMAMVGIVPTKVTAENGPIHRGDLLVTSSAPGFAMKGTDRDRLVGAVIGKAMGSLDHGNGVIEVLVTLQ